MQNTAPIIKRLTTGLNLSHKKIDPWPYWVFDDALPESFLDSLLELPFKDTKHYCLAGRREYDNDQRSYINYEAQNKYPVCKFLADAFLSREVLSTIEDKCNISLKKSYLRIEYTIDSTGFWLEPHTDIGVKNLTIFIYMSKDEDSESWGTDLYYDADRHWGKIASKSNRSFIFVPSDVTWHGFEQRQLRGVRKNLIINYVTNEWRNKHELVSQAPVA